MGFITKLGCKGCNEIEHIYHGVEGLNKEKKPTMKDSFLCKDCGYLNHIDIKRGEIVCKNCESTNLTKEFRLDEIRCSKCGEKKFERTGNLET